MKTAMRKQTVWLGAICLATSVIISQAGGIWLPWGNITIPNLRGGYSSAQLASDGANLYYSTLLDGVWRASLTDRVFYPLPMTGFPLWDGTTNTNGFAVWNLATTPQGTLVIAGSPVNFNTASNILSSPPSTFHNTLPVFYWWDETNQLWHAASVTNKSYPYTSSAGNFSVAPDGSLWTCSGFESYAYRSKDGGHSYQAFPINSLVPTNYFPLPFTTNVNYFGKVFGIAAGPGNEIVVGTETGGFLHTTNNGLKWTSLDPNFTNPASLNPLGRIGNALIAGVNRYGDFLCANFEMNGNYPGLATWYGVNLIGYHPADGTYYNAAGGFATNTTVGPGRVFTTPAGTSFTFMNQNYLLQGGVYDSPDGQAWTQFNQGSGLDFPFAPGITNAVGPGGCLTTLGNQVFIGVGSNFYVFDSTPPPVTNRPPVAQSQNINSLKNTPINLALSGVDADGDPLNYTLIQPPSHGMLTGSLPDLVYTPSNNFAGSDLLTFVVDDGIAYSVPAAVNLMMNQPTNQPPTISLTCSVTNGWVVGPTNVTLTATVSAVNGLQQVNFYLGTNFSKFVPNAPYTYTWTNLAPGDYVLSARVGDKRESTSWAPPVRVSVLATKPQLLIQNTSATNVSLMLPAALTNFYLEYAPDPTGPWSLCPCPPNFPTNSQIISVPTVDRQFFRIMHP